MNNRALLEYVIDASRRLAERRSLGVLLAYTLDEVLPLVGAERGSIVFAKPNGELDFKLQRDQNGNTFQEDGDKISRSILDEVIKTNKSLILRNAMTDPRFGQAQSVVYLQLRSIMCVPLITRHHTIGALYVENRSINGRFQNKDLATLELFTNQAATAIENATLNEELRMAHERTRLRLKQENLRLQNELLEKQTFELTRLNAEKDKFFSIVSHDLRAPFSILVTGTDFLADKFDELSTAEIKQQVKNLHDAAQMTHQLLENLLTWSRLQIGRIKHHPTERNLYVVVYDCMALLWETAVAKKIGLINSIDPKIFVYADEYMLATVIRNLLSNAIKFTNEGGEVTISCQCADRYSNNTETADEVVEISISDTGVGIPLDILDTLLKIDTQQSTVGTEQEKGTGLGLIICQEMIHKNGGEMQIESEVSVGTTVHFTLPLANNHPIAPVKLHES
ncbi:MAG: GAF domain-containing sensor histidine kinase [Chloroflexi bacterium]|nr:GAF domain-containing sensor histidine kinase [Chloroflexota bacterium]